MKVLISAPYMQPIVDRFLPLFKERNLETMVPHVNERLEEADLLPIIGDISGVICGDDRFTRRVLAAAPLLKVISKWGTGIDSIDQAACREFGISLRNTPNAFSEPVADSVLGYMLSFARTIPWATEAMRQGTWRKVPGFALREKTLGVIGVGNVGKAVIRRATAFGMPVIGCDIVPVDQPFIEQHRLTMVSRDVLLSTADFISINCDLNQSSYHLLNRESFRLVKPSSYVINTARGPIVDEPALVEALQEKRLAGAALDVFEHEPLPEQSPLRDMDNVLLAPHNANSSPEAWERVHVNTLNNLFTELGVPQL